MPWEAEGWVALQSAIDGAFVWLVKLERGEPVTTIRRAGNAIVARSEAYPFVVEWRIPIDEPEMITIERRRWQIPTVGPSGAEA